jgi:hypothetical protein
MGDYGETIAVKRGEVDKRKSGHLATFIYEIGRRVGSSESAKIAQDSVPPQKRSELSSEERVGNIALNASYHLTTVVNAVCKSVGTTKISEIEDLSVSPEGRPSNRGIKRIE